MIRNGELAPSFSLPDQVQKQHSLTDYNGRPLVILFFRGCFCPTSRKSLMSWQDFSRSASDLWTNIVAVSFDSISNHKQWADQFELKFPILSDEDLKVSSAYGIYINHWAQVGNYGEPALVIVDSEGKVAYSVISSGPKGLPDPESIAPILIYMSARDGKY